MKLVKSVLYYNANTVEKGNIFSTVMIDAKEENGMITLIDSNGYKDEIPVDFKGRFFVDETSVHLIKVALYREIKDDDKIEDIFKKNEKNVKKKALSHIKDTILMYRELYKNIYKILDKYNVNRHYDKDEIAPWGKLGTKES